MAFTTCFRCREAELLDGSCGAPKDVCPCFEPFAWLQAPGREGFARKVTRKKMLYALERAEKTGPVHVSVWKEPLRGISELGVAVFRERGRL